MLRRSYFIARLLLLSPVIGFAREAPSVDSPAFTTVPELSAGFDLLYQQKFAEAREAFANWKSRNPEDPFEVAGAGAKAEGELRFFFAKSGVATGMSWLCYLRALQLAMTMLSLSTGATRERPRRSSRSAGFS